MNCHSSTGSIPSTLSTTSRQHAIENLDLDFIFGGSATDLDDENEEPTSTENSASTLSTTSRQHASESLDLDAIFGGNVTDLNDENEPATIEDGDCYKTDISTSEVSKLRSHLTEDLSDQIDEFYRKLPSEFHEEEYRTFARFFSTANVEWQHMHLVSREIRSRGFDKLKRIQKADRSGDWSWENGRPSDCEYPRSFPVKSDEIEPPCSDSEYPSSVPVESDEIEPPFSDSEHSPSIPVESDKIEEPFHHLNFLGHPVYHKSSTPAEVSLWLVLTSHKKQTFGPISRQGVITSQATKHIDQFVYYGPGPLLQHSGTTLRNAVVGHVEKAYERQGTWPYDGLDEDDNVPKDAESINAYVYSKEAATGELQAPYRMGDKDPSEKDRDDTIINDDGKGSYTSKSPALKVHSKLCAVEFADYTSVEVTPTNFPAKEDSEPTESIPLSSPVSGGFVSTHSSSSGEPVVEESVEVTASEPGLGSTESPVLSVSEEAIFSPAEKTSSGYRDVFAACDRISKHVADQAACWNDVSAGLRALEPFLGLGSQKTAEKEEGTYSFQSNNISNVSQILTSNYIVAEIPSGDLDVIPLEPGFNEMFYGPIAIAVGHKAFQLANWVSSRLW